jgi:hypothetical protein
MKALVWQSRKTERAARRAMFKNNMAYYLLLLTGCLALLILLHELARGALRAIALAGILLALAAMLGVLAIRLLLDYQAARDTRASRPALAEFHFGTKYITLSMMPLEEAGARRAPEADGDTEKLPYADIRALKEDGGYLYLFRSSRQPPIVIGLGTEGIGQIRKILIDRTGIKKIGRI